MEQLLIRIGLVVLGFVVCFVGLRFRYSLLPLVGAAIHFPDARWVPARPVSLAG